MSELLLEVRNLSKHFVSKRGFGGRQRSTVRAVNGVSFGMQEGETLGVVGESGSGKTTLGRCILRLEQPSSGAVVYDGQDITAMDAATMRGMRRRMQMIFQDPYGSLNPRLSVFETVVEAMRIHRLFDSRSEEEDRVVSLLRKVGLRPEHMSRYPHEFSGGQRQRIGIARALAVEPEFIIADEPLSALDVSVQAQIVNLLTDLQADLGLSYLFIAHDLNVVRFFCQRVAVMYLGRLVELAPADVLYAAPKHPYTRSLLGAIPRLPLSSGTCASDLGAVVKETEGSDARHSEGGNRDLLEGEIPDLLEVSPGHWVACRDPNELS